MHGTAALPDGQLRMLINRIKNPAKMEELLRVLEAGGRQELVEQARTKLAVIQQSAAQ